MYRFFCQYIFLLHRHLRPKFWVSSPRQHPNYKILIPFHLIWSVRTEWFWNNIVNVVYFTLICYISGISRSVIFGKKNPEIFLVWRFWWRHTSNIWNLVIISQNSKGSSTYTINILSTWRHHRQKFALDFFPRMTLLEIPGFWDFFPRFTDRG